MDFTIDNTTTSGQAVEDVYALAAKRGINPGDITVLDEYKDRSGANWTAPHIHVQFANQDVAAALMGSGAAPRLALGDGVRPAGRDAAALTSRNQGQGVYVMNHQPTTVSAPNVVVQAAGPTVVPMPIRTESIESTHWAMTRVNFV